MPSVRSLLSLCTVVLALAVLLAKPLAARADGGDATAPSTAGSTPGTTGRSLQPLPLVTPHFVRQTASHHSLALAFGDRVARFAKRLLGVRYQYGGTSPSTGFDCSGFVRYVYGHFGVTLAHSSFAQFLGGRRVAKRSLEPGDLVFFDQRGHVGIYIGNGRFIHAPHTGTRVRIETLAGWYGSRYDGARRVGKYT